MLKKLVALKIIKTTADGQYILTRDSSHLTLYDLLQLLPYRWPNKTDLDTTESSVAKLWYETIYSADQALEKALHRSIDGLFQNK